jgi:hypothetical protein
MLLMAACARGPHRIVIATLVLPVGQGQRLRWQRLVHPQERFELAQRSAHQGTAGQRLVLHYQ